MNTNTAQSGMKTLGKKALCSVLLAGGITVLGSTAASALDLDLLGEDGILADTGVLADIGVPLTVENNSISIIGDSSTGSTAPTAENPSSGASVTAPVSSIISIGVDDSTLTSGAIHIELLDGVLNNHASGPVAIGSLVSVWLTSPGQVGILDLGLVDVSGAGIGDIANGTGIAADALVPVSVTCNSVSVVGSSNSGCATSTSTPTDPGDPGDPGDSSTPGATGGGLAGTGSDVNGAIGVGALALLLGAIVTLVGRRFGVSA